ncbi:uncharacterized protein PpBr36_11083 [Pyricularia pennisetigena]|uniref:uncharacterized protein n=1 Tax=Pyricularia pennisetigena TaxID=1578925 RepID=UPI001154D50E|nr:uncharacterized protein PpBr36_11083 [Pyricularia pennisetigena]TLS20663.1 hypothetical protein PpBr36_11083 [Pyricularia pennisetigena]
MFKLRRQSCLFLGWFYLKLKENRKPGDEQGSASRPSPWDLSPVTLQAESVDLVPNGVRSTYNDVVVECANGTSYKASVVICKVCNAIQTYW